MKTIGSVLTLNGGVGPGFSAMRLALAFGVVAWHCFPATNGKPQFPEHGPWWALIYCIVPMFFALSGFLVTGSAVRLPLLNFAISRGLRIAPALVVDTAVSILVFGLAFTTLPPMSFLSHSLTLHYWLNCVGEIHYYLPGVFDDLPTRMVNVSLWTIPGELCCYIAMAALIFAGLVNSWRVPLVGIALIFGVDVVYHVTDAHLHMPLEKQLAGDSGKLIAVFLLGVIFYSQRFRIPASPLLAVLAAAYMAACAAFGAVSWLTNPIFTAGATLALTYLVIWLGLQKIPLPWPFAKGDYSYGIYLYGFPVQQAVVHLTGTRSPLVVFVVSVLPIWAMAALSWHAIEKPTLALRRRLQPRRPTESLDKLVRVDDVGQFGEAARAKD